MDRSARILKQLDTLEAELHQGAGEMNTYALLVERHGQVEQVTCKVSDEHVAEIHRLATAQQEKQRERRAARSRTVVSRSSERRRSLLSN
jgi:hypothetical protein